ncbi:MAG: glycosyltransferase family 39 protein [Actinobacteria bacterium]|nr:glycosyltransferase family 39 protein [Actinomycetota bacterium]
MASPARLARFYPLALLAFIVLFLALGLSGIDRSCLDAADSSYLITSRALADGQMPYRDFLVAHPPLLFLLGAPLARLGAGVIPFRIFTLLLMAGLGVAVWRLAFRITANQQLAIVAGVLTLFAPLGLFFSKTFINDYLVSLIAVISILLLMGRSRAAIVGAGALAVLGTLTKLTILPFILVCIAYVLIFRRKLSWIYIVVAVGGSLTAALAAQWITDGAYLADILGAQSSKGYNFANLFDGLRRIWQMDWPLMVPAWVGAWFAAKALRNREKLGGELKGRLFLLVGWLLAGVAVLGTLPAEGHDTNLFLIAEPAVAVLAAWGIVALAERGSLVPLLLIAAWLVFAVPNLVNKSGDYFFRSNESDVAVIVAETINRSTDCQPVLIPGCYALEAGRPVTLDFYDPFLWEEKYKRGDENAIALFDGLRMDLAGVKPPVVVFAPGQPSAEILQPELADKYQVDYHSESWPPIDLWVPKAAKAPG